MLGLKVYLSSDKVDTVNHTNRPDPRLKETGRRAIPVFSRVVALLDPVIQHLFPELTDDQRTEFNQEVIRDLRDPKYHLYCKMYIPAGFACLLDSYCIVARKAREDN